MKEAPNDQLLAEAYLACPQLLSLEVKVNNDPASS